MTRPLTFGPFTEEMMVDALAEADCDDDHWRQARFVIRLLHEVGNGFIRNQSVDNPDYWKDWLIEHAKIDP